MTKHELFIRAVAQEAEMRGEGGVRNLLIKAADAFAEMERERGRLSEIIKASGIEVWESNCTVPFGYTIHHDDGAYTIRHEGYKIGCTYYHHHEAAKACREDYRKQLATPPSEIIVDTSEWED